VVDDAVDHRGGDGLVSEDASPAGERQVGHQDMVDLAYGICDDNAFKGLAWPRRVYQTLQELTEITWSSSRRGIDWRDAQAHRLAVQPLVDALRAAVAARPSSDDHSAAHTSVDEHRDTALP
jgi:hypothetical protein